MLSRGNSDAATRLRRAKSTSSVPQRISHPLNLSSEDDPTSTYLNARAAATKAFGQYNERRKLGNERRLKNKRSWFSHHKTLSTPGAHLARQRSDSSRHGRPSTSKSSNNVRLKARTSTASIPPEFSVQALSLANANFDQSYSPSVIGYNNELCTAPRPPLRKSVSTPGPESPLTRSGSIATNAATVLQKPMSGASLNLSATYLDQRYSRDDVVAATRDQYLKDNKARTLARRRSFLPAYLGVFGKRNKEESKNNVRSFSTGIVEVNSYKPSNTQQDRLTLGGKAKRVSKSLKKRLRRAFDRSSETESRLPAQQVHARQSHFGKTSMMTFTGFSGSYDPSNSHQESDYADSVDHEAGLASFQANESSTSQDNQAENVLASSHPDGPPHVRSRVTSWNDSSGHNSLNLPEIKQLSSIDEYDESSRESLKSRHNEVLSLFPRKRHSKANMGETSDIRRLFSAVRQRVERSSFNDASDEDFDVIIHPRPTDLKRNESPLQTKKTKDLSPTVKLLPRLVHEESATSQGDSRNQFCIPGHERDTMMSPSIYSFRDEPNTLDAKEHCDSDEYYKTSVPGTAVVESTKPVAKWNLQEHKPLGQNRAVLTSNEWREWANEETSELNGSVPLTIVNFKQGFQRRDRGQGHVREDTQIDDSETEIGPRMTMDRTSPLVGSRLRLGQKSSSFMNDRFPMIDTGQVPTNRSISSLRQQSSDEGSGSSKRSGSGSWGGTHKTQQKRHSASDHRRVERSPSYEESALRLRATGIASDRVSRIQGNTSLTSLKLPPRDKDGQIEDHEEGVVLQSRKENGPSTPQNRRKYQARQSPLDDHFLRAIRKGPYLPASPSPGHVRNSIEVIPSKVFVARKSGRSENTPPNKSTSPATQRLVKDFLDSRKDILGDASHNASGSSPVFL